MAAKKSAKKSVGKKSKKKAAKKKAAKKKAAKKRAKSSSVRAASSSSPPWSNNNAAHQRLYVVLFDHRMVEDFFDDVGAFQLADLQYWLSASAELREFAAKNYASRLVVQLLTWFPSAKPRSGTAQSDYDNAFDGIRDIIVDAENNTIRDLGNSLDEYYRSW